MKFAKLKKKHPRKVHKVGGTDHLTDEGLNGSGRTGPGFSYRGKWANEGCPDTFEAWLVNKGVMPKQQ
ncbi:hypothetical protein [Sinorhizobium sojae]|uniref:hypothetical protein n=1 Tax=Sinorhizobium sojae TaxID=716925 RepID=UPI00054D89AE|nr:hypothetical protein [Sinorhizobium sojae]